MPKLSHQAASQHTLLLIGVLLIATNLRAPFTGLPPVLDLITKDFNLSTTMAGLVLTLPLLAFAILSPVSAWIGKKLGLARALFVGIIAIAIGIILRSLGMPWALFVGTAIIGIGIAVGNVLLPSLIKQRFPNSITAITGGYVLTMGIAATLASAGVVPLSALLGWPTALAALVVLPLIAIIVWIPQLRDNETSTTVVPQASLAKILRSALAWQVTLFLGLNSVISYIAISWLPTILIDSGLTPEKAGSMHGVLQLAIALPGLIIGPIVRRMRDQRIPAMLSACCMAAGFLGLMLLPNWALIWSVLLGLGSGASFILGLAFIGLRTEHASQAAVLSGMAQCIGYLLAAIGPVAMGVLHDSLKDWHLPLALCVALALLDGFIGILAGRKRTIN